MAMLASVRCGMPVQTPVHQAAAVCPCSTTPTCSLPLRWPRCTGRSASRVPLGDGLSLQIKHPLPFSAGSRSLPREKTLTSLIAIASYGAAATPFDNSGPGGQPHVIPHVTPETSSSSSASLEASRSSTIPAYASPITGTPAFASSTTGTPAFASPLWFLVLRRLADVLWHFGEPSSTVQHQLLARGSTASSAAAGADGRQPGSGVHQWEASHRQLGRLGLRAAAVSGGVLLLSSSLSSFPSLAKESISSVVLTLRANPTFMSGLIAWALAQVLKVFTHYWVMRRWNWKMIVGSGGMPSSHSALCAGLTLGVALTHGVSDALFPVCLGFSSIVMYDAAGVRRHAGKQAEVLNYIIRESLEEGHPLTETQLKELLGHTPLQVAAGACLGAVVAVCWSLRGHL